MVELIWEGKYVNGKKSAPVRIALPFQDVETVNESDEDRRRWLEAFGYGQQDRWRNRLIWGDKKYVLPSLLPEFAGKVDLIYIDPPFDTGADFSFTATIPDDPYTEGDQSAQFVKQPNIIEQKAYRDTWGRGLDSYLQWFYQTMALLHELLAESGTLFVHLGIQVNHYAKVILDEIFGKDNFITEIIWSYGTPSGGRATGNKIIKAHEYILAYAKRYGSHCYNKIYLTYSDKYVEERFTFIDEYGRRYRTRKRESGVIERQYLGPVFKSQPKEDGG